MHKTYRHQISIMSGTTSRLRISKLHMFPPRTTALTSSQKDSHIHLTPTSFLLWACLLVEGECCYSDFLVTQFPYLVLLFPYSYFSLPKHFILCPRLIYSTYIRSYIPHLCCNPHIILLASFSSPTPFCSES